MLDLAAPAAAVGYGIGRIGCLTSGDGDYGRNTTSTVGGALCAYERAGAAAPGECAGAADAAVGAGGGAGDCVGVVAAGGEGAAAGLADGVYLVLSGAARFVVEFWRVNPKLYFGHTCSNAQVAALGSVVVGCLVMVVVRGGVKVGGRVPVFAGEVGV